MHLENVFQLGEIPGKTDSIPGFLSKPDAGLVLIISDNPKSLKLIEDFRPFIDEEVIQADDLVEGLKVIYEKRPKAVFIQDEIEGNSGENIARHIKNLFSGDAPRMILLHSFAVHTPYQDSACDDSISLSSLESKRQFLIFKSKLQNIAMARSGSADQVEVISPRVQGTGPSLPYQLMRKGILASGLICGVLLLIIWFVDTPLISFYKSRLISLKNFTLNKLTLTEPVGSGLDARLSYLVPLNNSDPKYASLHPGWEKYTSREYEFRLFRENGAVKAIQVVTVNGEAIAWKYLVSFVREISGSEIETVHSREKKDGYVIEERMAGQKAEVRIYRRKNTGNVTAFVVAFAGIKG